MANNMNWDDMRFFLALARSATVSAAGRELKVKHTTVARRISALEEHLGARLFDHLKEGYAMTQAGEELYEHACNMEEQAQAIDRRVFGMDSQLKGSLKLAASHDVLTRLIIPHLHKFNQAYPNIDLQLLGSTAILDLSARQADIAIRFTTKPPEYLVGKKVLDLRHGIYASEKYLSTKRNTDEVIIWGDQQGNPHWVKHHFAKAKVVMRVDDINSMVTCVTHDLGLARLPCYIADLDPNLRRLDKELVPSTWGCWILSHVDLRATAKVRACKEFIEDVLLQQKDLVEGRSSVYFEE